MSVFWFFFFAFFRWVCDGGVGGVVFFPHSKNSTIERGLGEGIFGPPVDLGSLLKKLIDEGILSKEFLLNNIKRFDWNIGI